MAELLNIAAISIGFVAAICFCIGAATSDAEQISEIASTYWNCNESLARSLAAQRAQYAVGALFLVVSFVLQGAAILATSSSSPTLPLSLPRGVAPFLVVLLPAAALAWFAVRSFAASTTNKVMQILQKQATK
ncbi:MAG: hypothetical protein LLH30_06180 [Candidatus Manganitrophus sp. SA1]|nr:hypothetical protein [Candidatus Manganitrophus morganii]